MTADITALRRAIIESDIDFKEIIPGHRSMVVTPCTREVFGAVKEMVRDLHLDTLWVERTDFNFFTVKTK